MNTVTFYYKSGATQVLHLHPSFFSINSKDKKSLTPNQKCQDIAHDLGAIKFVIERT